MQIKKQKEESRKRKSRLITKKLLRIRVFQKAKTVMFYIALNGEVNTQEMIKEARKLGKIVTVPVCRKDKIHLSPCILDERAGLKIGPYGVAEPVIEKCVRLKDLDLVVVPGLAFDKKGNRLGRGKGFYDRFLRELPERATSIGLAFNFQILPSIPAASHDVSVDKILFA